MTQKLCQNRTSQKPYRNFYLVETNTDQKPCVHSDWNTTEYRLSDAVSRLKINASIHIRKKLKLIRELYLEKDGMWSVGNCITSVGLDEGIVKKHIEWQGKKREAPNNLVVLGLFLFRHGSFHAELETWEGSRCCGGYGCWKVSGIKVGFLLARLALWAGKSRGVCITMN